MPLTALSIDDNYLLRKHLAILLQDVADAHVVGWAETAQEAARIAQWWPDWQLIVLDLELKQGTGYDVLISLRQRGPNQHICVFSNHVAGMERDWCFELGADGVFDKTRDIAAFFDFLEGVRSGSPRARPRSQNPIGVNAASLPSR